MRGLIVTRHQAVAEFVKEATKEKSYQPIEWDVKSHLVDAHEALPYGVVAGILPLQLWAYIRNARRWAVILPDLPVEMRGRELTLDDMRKLSAAVVEVTVGITAPKYLPIELPSDCFAVHKINGWEDGASGKRDFYHTLDVEKASSYVKSLSPLFLRVAKAGDVKNAYIPTMTEGYVVEVFTDDEGE